MSGVHKVESADAESVHTRRLRRQQERRLPRGLRSDIARVRRDDLACDILDGLFGWVTKVAEREGVLRSYPTLLGRIPYVPAAHERRILRQLEGDRAFRGKIRQKVREHLRQAHLTRTAPPALVPDYLGRAPEPKDGLLVVRSNLGLGTGSILDAEPEELNLLVHDLIVGEWRGRQDNSDLGLDDPSSAHVLVVGSGGSGFAKVVAVRRSAFPGVVVHQSDDLITTKTDLPCISIGVEEGTQFNFALILLRCPAEGGAANHGYIYDGASDDVSMMGATRWMAEAEGLLRAVEQRVGGGATVFVVAPGSIRTGVGYRPAPELLAAVLHALEDAGLKLAKQHRVVEIHPAAQPFVGRSRPERLLLIARKTEVPS